MTNHLQVALEIGPKGKKVVAVASAWPGLARGAANEQAALERLRAYIPRYASVAALAGLESAFAATNEPEIVERYPGTGSTDFWGISFAFSEHDQQPVSNEELERELALLRACWAFFDTVRAQVSPEMRRGPRGGGRDRDRIVGHTLGAEQGWAKKLGLATPQDRLLTDEELAPHRDEYCGAIRALHAEHKPARTWPLRYLIRHTAFHTLDHTWEMQDKDLTGTTTGDTPFKCRVFGG